MERSIDTIHINSLEQVPSLEYIQSIPREISLRLVFSPEINHLREKIGKDLKKALPAFQLGVHMIEPEISIVKLITEAEIDENQDFFENCAKDYRQLGTELIYKLVDKLGMDLNKDFPLQSFNSLKSSRRKSGSLENWNYFLHGFHCGFEHKQSGQEIEVSLVFGQEFGDLDPYFFTLYIKTTPAYYPLPIKIFDNYADGARINERMIALGKFEIIGSNVGGHYGTVVTDREKFDIKSASELAELYKPTSPNSKKRNFNFWKGFRKK